MTKADPDPVHSQSDQLLWWSAAESLISTYSRISIARTPMARSPCLTRTRFLSPCKIFLKGQVNKYLRKLSKAILMSILNIHLLGRRSTDFPELAIFVSWSGTMINLHWLKLHMAWTIFHGPKGIWAIEVRLYSKTTMARTALGP